jgi:hypothetical protein
MASGGAESTYRPVEGTDSGSLRSIITGPAVKADVTASGTEALNASSGYFTRIPCQRDHEASGKGFRLPAAEPKR